MFLLGKRIDFSILTLRHRDVQNIYTVVCHKKDGKYKHISPGRYKPRKIIVSYA